MRPDRRYPIGAELLTSGAVRFRVWAPERKRVDVKLESDGKMESAAGSLLPMESENNGYFSLTTDQAKAGSLYRYLLDGTGPFADPASRFQPEGPHGPSQVIDPGQFTWTDQHWTGVAPDQAVIYEMHLGTFTPEGTWASAEKELTELASVGITCIEVMPVNDFPGKFGWGYDGVNLFAPSRLYGTPDEFRSFVNSAHELGIGVILDVVYNHIGPDGNFLCEFAKDYFTDKHKTDWGKAINFDGSHHGPVREFFLANARYWIDEFHLDGLRLDATQNIYDDSPPARHILTEVGRVVRKAARGKTTFIVNENESQHSELARPEEQGGFGLDALWNDDYHHSAMVALTGKSEAYYTDYRGKPQELISAVKYGYLYQGQWYSWQKQRRGHPALDLPARAFVNFLQNHDQVANSALGLRVHQLSSPGKYRAMHALTLLAPGTPMLFQGQEFACNSPFFYFADHGPELGEMVRKGRLEFLTQFPSLKDEAVAASVPVPNDPKTFERCKLNFEERQQNEPAYRLTKDLLRLRKSDRAFSRQSRVDGAVLGDHALVLRFFQDDGMDRLVIVNLGSDLDFKTCPEPLLAPPQGYFWDLALSTEQGQYGGGGATVPDTKDQGWHIAGESTVVLVPTKKAPAEGGSAS